MYNFTSMFINIVCFHQGTYTLGDVIVPQTYTKLSVKDGKTVAEDFTIKGNYKYNFNS